MCLICETPDYTIHTYENESWNHPQGSPWTLFLQQNKKKISNNWNATCLYLARDSTLNDSHTIRKQQPVSPSILPTVTSSSNHPHLHLFSSLHHSAPLSQPYWQDLTSESQLPDSQLHHFLSTLPSVSVIFDSPISSLFFHIMNWQSLLPALSFSLSLPHQSHMHTLVQKPRCRFTVLCWVISVRHQVAINRV